MSRLPTSLLLRLNKLREALIIQKAEEIVEAIEARGDWGAFLPTYSPDFNPIENF